MGPEEIDKRIESIKRNFERVVEALGDIDADREHDKKEFNRRITALEYAYARMLEENKKAQLKAEIKELKARITVLERAQT